LDRHTKEILELLETAGLGLRALLTRLTQREDVASDLMQDLFLTLYKSNGYRRADNPRTYAYQTAIHLACKWRTSSNRNPQTKALVEEPTRNAPAPLNKLIQAEELEHVLAAIYELKEPYRYAMVMHWVQQQPYEAIADELGKTTHQVRALCHRAISQVRSLLNQTISTRQDR